MNFQSWKVVIWSAHYCIHYSLPLVRFICCNNLICEQLFQDSIGMLPGVNFQIIMNVINHGPHYYSRSEFQNSFSLYPLLQLAILESPRLWLAPLKVKVAYLVQQSRPSSLWNLSTWLPVFLRPIKITIKIGPKTLKRQPRISLVRNECLWFTSHPIWGIFFFFFFFSAVLGLHCYLLAFSCYTEWASHCGGFSCGVQALGHQD